MHLIEAYQSVGSERLDLAICLNGLLVLLVPLDHVISIAMVSCDQPPSALLLNNINQLLYTAVNQSTGFCSRLQISSVTHHIYMHSETSTKKAEIARSIQWIGTVPYVCTHASPCMIDMKTLLMLCRCGACVS